MTLGQGPLSLTLVTACKVQAALRRDRMTEYTAHVLLQQLEVLNGRPREALAALLTSLNDILRYGDGPLWSKTMITAARCYDRTSEDGARQTEVIHSLCHLPHQHIPSNTPFPTIPPSPSSASPL